MTPCTHLPGSSSRTCSACWQRRASRFTHQPTADEPSTGPLARVVCLTLAGMLRQVEHRYGGAAPSDADALLLACIDGSTLYTLGRTLGLSFEALRPQVQAHVDAGLMELLPELAPTGLAPALSHDDIAPALGGDRHLADEPFREAPAVRFNYPSRTTPRPTPEGRFQRRR